MYSLINMAMTTASISHNQHFQALRLCSWSLSDSTFSDIKFLSVKSDDFFNAYNKMSFFKL